MIQILAAMPQGGEQQNALAITSQEGGTASFVALFAQALLQGATADAAPAGKPVVAALAGHGKRLPELGLDDPAGGISLAAQQTAAGPADAAAAALATATVAKDGKTDAVSELVTATADMPEAAVELAGAADEADVADVADQALMAMLAMPGEAQSAVEAAANSADGGDDAVGVTTVADEGGRTGKKLPSPMAVLAVQKQALASIQKGDGQSPAELAGRPFAAAAVDSGLAGEPDEAAPAATTAAGLSAAKELPAQAAATAVSNTSLSGSEAALAAARPHAASGAQGKAVLGMQSPMGSAAWQQELGDKLVWVNSQRGQMADLVLNPPSLGAVEVRLNMSGGEASAQFFAANPQVREALEAALPKLRELMGSAGISLGEATVSDQSFGQRDKAETGRSGGQAGIVGVASADETVVQEAVRTAGRGLLDYFA